MIIDFEPRIATIGARATVKLRCDERFKHAFTACSCVFKEITLVAQTKVISLKTQMHAVYAR